MIRFSGQSALVTGGARGIGLACAARLASEGAAHVGLVDLDGAEAMAATLNAAGGSLNYGLLPIEVWCASRVPLWAWNRR